MRAGRAFAKARVLRTLSTGRDMFRSHGNRRNSGKKEGPASGCYGDRPLSAGGRWVGVGRGSSAAAVPLKLVRLPASRRSGSRGRGNARAVRRNPCRSAGDVTQFRQPRPRSARHIRCPDSPAEPCPTKRRNRAGRAYPWSRSPAARGECRASKRRRHSRPSCRR